MEKLIFQRATKNYKSQQVIRIDLELYNKMLEICNKTGNSIATIANKCIDYALENSEVE